MSVPCATYREMICLTMRYIVTTASVTSAVLSGGHHLIYITSGDTVYNIVLLLPLRLVYLLHGVETT